MNIFQRAVNWVSGAFTQIKAMALPLVPNWVRYAFTPITFRNSVMEGYKGNGVVFACIQKLAFAFRKPKIKVWLESVDGKDAIPNHALAKLLKKPNPSMGFDKLLWFTIVYMAIGGNAYWYKVRSRSGKVVELWPLHDGQITPVAGRTTLVSHYEFDNGGDTLEMIDPKDIVHFMWMPDPLAPWKGLAPLVAVAREVDTDNEATRYLFSLLKNDAMPRLALIAPDSVDLENPDLRKRMKEEWSQEHGGDGRGRIALLDNGFDLKQIALNLKELEFNVLRRVPEARICAAFGVPPIVAGVNVGLENATYSNFKEAILLFTEETLVPLWGMADDEIQSSLLPEFSKNESEIVEFDLTTVTALADKMNEQRKWALDALGRGGVTVNEFRSVYGLRPDIAGDVYLRTMATVTEPFVFDVTIPDDIDTTSTGVAEGAAGNASLNGAQIQSALAIVVQVQTGQISHEAGLNALQLFFGFTREQADRLLAGKVDKPADDTPPTKPDPQLPPPEPTKQLSDQGDHKGSPQQTKSRVDDQRKIMTALRTTRREVAKRMEVAIDRFFQSLGDRAVYRARRLKTFGGTVETKADLPDAEDLITDSDWEEFDGLLKSYFLEVMQASWDTYQLNFGGLYQPFDPDDPAVTAVIANSTARLDMISDTTSDMLQYVLEAGSTQGWSIDHLVRGDPENGIPGLRDVVTETYKNRARTIARTELGNAQQKAAVGRYGAAGVDKVRVFDNGFDDSAPGCIILGNGNNGTVVPLAWAEKHALGHPNCVRCFAAEFDAPVDEDILASWEAVGDAWG